MVEPRGPVEGNDELKVSSKIFKAVLFCLVHVYLYKEERRKHEQRSYAAVHGCGPFLWLVLGEVSSKWWYVPHFGPGGTPLPRPDLAAGPSASS